MRKRRPKHLKKIRHIKIKQFLKYFSYIITMSILAFTLGVLIGKIILLWIPIV